MKLDLAIFLKPICKAHLVLSGSKRQLTKLEKLLSILEGSRNLARQISRDLNSDCFAMVLTAGFYCARKVRVVKYIVVYGQIKAADQKYCHNQKWR